MPAHDDVIDFKKPMNDRHFARYVSRYATLDIAEAHPDDTSAIAQKRGLARLARVEIRADASRTGTCMVGYII